MARLSFDALRLGQLIADVWDDPKKRRQLLTDPHATLAEAGVEIDETKRIVVHEDTESTINIVIPRRPKNFQASDEHLERIGIGMLEGCDIPRKPSSARVRTIRRIA